MCAHGAALGRIALASWVVWAFTWWTAAAAEPTTADSSGSPTTAATPTESGGGSSSVRAAGDSSSGPSHTTLLKEAKSISGMWTLYEKETELYVELNPGDYGSEYIILISIARGIAQEPLVGGFSWSFGDDWVWQFRKVGKRVHIIRRNVRFKATKGSPEWSSVQNAYTDSVLFSLPIVTKGPKGGDLVDLSPVLMSDLPQISNFLPGFAFSASKSSWASIKGFPDNVQIQVAATYASGGSIQLDSVPDSRGVTINVHYSISKLPSSGYSPRLADDRVGYFLTVVKDYSKKDGDDQFIRYINRWHLEKPAAAGSGPSPPKEPIIFWIEKTVPYEYRAPIREGIAEWNKAFEKAGWLNAIEVRQQPDDAEWDPEDINYNTFRWITSDAGFAMGPSRVNPYTGQILDADIIFDADFVKFWKREFESLTPEAIAEMTGGAVDRTAQAAAAPETLLGLPLSYRHCLLSRDMARQMALGAAVILATAEPSAAGPLQEKLIMQGVKEVTMHEVGHTLGLRHNFKGSRLYRLDQLNDGDSPPDGMMVASVMDYAPVNIVSQRLRQGNYYSDTIGPYDYWAIEYGYKPLGGGTGGETSELRKIAARSGEPQLAYATDEDTGGMEPDPDANRFDLGSDPFEYAQDRARLVNEAIPGLVDRLVKDGDDYTVVRKAFNVLLSQRGQAMFFVARYIGGLYISRSHRGDADARPPLTVVELEKQRQALALLEELVFDARSFEFPPELYAYLGTSNWSHWGNEIEARKDFPLHETILEWQTRILDQLLSCVTLRRIYDTELQIPADKDALTTAELMERLTRAIFSELEGKQPGEFSNRRPAISSFRRNLQAAYQERLSQLALGQSLAPDDCQRVAAAELATLAARIKGYLVEHPQLDRYSQAHLQEAARSIEKVLDARLTRLAP